MGWFWSQVLSDLGSEAAWILPEVFVSCSWSCGWNMLTMKKNHKQGVTGTGQESLRDLED